MLQICGIPSSKVSFLFTLYRNICPQMFYTFLRGRFWPNFTKLNNFHKFFFFCPKNYALSQLQIFFVKSRDFLLLVTSLTPIVLLQIFRRWLSSDSMHSKEAPLGAWKGEWLPADCIYVSSLLFLLRDDPSLKKINGEKESCCYPIWHSRSFKGFFPGIDQWSAKWSPSSAQQRTTVNSVTLWQQCFLKTKEKLFSKHEESLVVKPVDQISSWEISGLYMLVKYLTRYRYQLSIHAITGCPSRFWIIIKSWLKLD